MTETCITLAEEPGLGELGDLSAKRRSIAGDIRLHLDERAGQQSPPGA
jgi:hypothetical protein